MTPTSESHQPVQTKELYEKDYDVSSFLTNASGKLGLYALLNLLQDIAHFHANLLGFGYEDMVAKKTFWVLTRQKLVMSQWPEWDQKIRIKTWIRKGSAAFTNRDFAIYLNGQRIGESTTTWMTLDAESRRPKLIDYSEILSSLNTDKTISVQTDRMAPIDNDAQTLAEFKVRNSDIDQNDHVNNTKYAQWVLDAIPFALHHQYELQSYSINFLAETKLNDLIKIQSNRPLDNAEDQFIVDFQGFRESDSKVVFSAKIEVKKITF